MTITHHVGQALDIARTLPDASVDLVTSSPPFLALRNYNDVDGQWGSEASPAAFLDNLLELAVELRRVLTPTGSLAFEIGDTYSASGGSGGDYDRNGMRAGQPKANGSASKTRPDGGGGHMAKGHGRPPLPVKDDRWPLTKSLTGVPTLFAWSLAYGRNLLNPDHTFDPWRIRNIIVWARNNPPVGALGDKYRPATSYITVATPSARRWFDLDAVRGPASPNTHARAPKGRGGNWDTLDEIAVIDGSPPRDHWSDEYDGATTWLINTVGSSLAHYAMWPAALAQRLVLSMCPAKVCRSCREPRRRIVATEYVDRNGQVDPAAGGRSFVDHSGPKDIQGRRLAKGEPHLSSRSSTIGWSDCGHGNYRPGVVLDPFYGTGTTGAVADLYGRDAIGIDLDPANTELHGPRYDEVKRALFGVAPPMPGQMELLA